MIMPIDIQKKEFARALRGYKEEEVDNFLAALTQDLESLLQDNRRLRDSVSALTGEVERYRNAENAVLETLEAAKALMGDISASAEKRAEILLNNAEMDAGRIQREARESVERLTEEAASLRNRVSTFSGRYKNLLETELERFDTLSAELFAGADLGDLPEGDPEEGREVKSSLRPLQAAPHSGAAQKADPRTITNLRSGDGI
jgi:cell division initiation protein